MIISNHWSKRDPVFGSFLHSLDGVRVDSYVAGWRMSPSVTLAVKIELCCSETAVWRSRVKPCLELGTNEKGCNDHSDACLSISGCRSEQAVRESHHRLEL